MRCHNRILQVILLSLGFAGLFWSVSVFPVFRVMAPAREATTRLLAEERFKKAELMEIQARLGLMSNYGMRRWDTARAQALVSLSAMGQMTLTDASPEFDRAFDATANQIRLALALNPTDSFLWLMLYSSATARSGFAEAHIRFIEQSYATGPFESWIAMRRSRLALAIYPMFSESMQQLIVSEFVALVDSGFIEESKAVLTSTGWPQRERLLASLYRADIISREALAKMLARDGISVSIPGVEVDERWWR